jgi:HK97 family phage major capsid protein
MPRCTELLLSTNSIMLPKDETTPWGTTGLQVYWEAEAGQVSQSKGVFESSQFRLYKLMALAPVTEELLEDAVGFQSWIDAKVPGIISHKVNTAIVSGNGAGMPLGILNSPSLISVAKATSQPADTVWFKNVQDMWGRMYAPWRRNAVWLINQDVEGSLEAMAFQPFGASSHLPTAASTPVYLPPGGIADAPYGRLKGRPVLPLQAAKTIGDQGDIILVDLKQYWLARKAQGIKADTSMHLYFDQATMAFRWIFRVNGQPAWSAAITPENGSNTLSWAVVLDAR